MTGAFFETSVAGALARVAALVLVVAAVTMGISFLYRVRVKARLPDGVVLLVGLGTVSLSLNTRLALVQFLGDQAQPLSLGNAMWTLATFVVAGVAALWGRRFGEQLGESGRFSAEALRPELSPIVRATGRFITVELPDEIGDIEGYDPVPDETKAKLDGRSFDFPRGLTVAELRAQLADRLKEKHHVGYVDVDLTEDGEVGHLAVGQRAVGLGPALPPGFVAVPVRADPPLSATPGDAVQVWTRPDASSEPQRLGRGELRATAGDVATIAVRPPTARKIDHEERYRLVTTAAGSNADREFASMLRRADETLSVVEFTEDSPLIGVSIRALDLTIVAVECADGTVETLPTAARSIQPGDRLHALGRPESLRKLHATRGCLVQSL